MAATRITIRDHGPLSIEGDFEILDATGKAYGLGGRTRVSLCRCGQSSDKPFCDGAHKACSFQSAGAARDLAPPKA